MGMVRANKSTETTANEATADELRTKSQIQEGIDEAKNPTPSARSKVAYVAQQGLNKLIGATDKIVHSVSWGKDSSNPNMTATQESVAEYIEQMSSEALDTEIEIDAEYSNKDEHPVIHEPNTVTPEEVEAGASVPNEE